MIKHRFTLFFIFSTLFSFSQSNTEYLGAIMLSDSSLITYKIVIEENKNNTLSGYSITDLGGEHETKSLIKGSFGDKKTISFNEYDIVYTKSYISQEDFCFVNFTGVVSNKKIEGTFKGLYADGIQCIDGEIKLTQFNKVYKRINRIDKKIDRNILVSKEKKKNIHLTKDLDSLNMNILRAGKSLTVFSKDEFITLTIYDSGKEDGDIIKLTVNDKIILDNFTIKAKKKSITIPLTQEQNLITLEALNEGYSPPNTVKMEITDSKNITHTRTILKKGEIASVVIYQN